MSTSTECAAADDVPIDLDAPTEHQVTGGAGHIPASRRVRTAVVRNCAIIVLLWYTAVVAFVLTKFWADFFG